MRGMIQGTPIQINKPKLEAFPVRDEQTKVLIIGYGEIGSSLYRVLQPAYKLLYKKDISDEINGEFDIVHITYPYSDRFIEITKAYIRQYIPRLAIIHSTVKPGTTRKIGGSVVHSPINGRHPKLDEGILRFTKFIGALEPFSAYEAVTHLNKAGIQTQVFASPEATELAKILCTTRYGVAICEMKETERLCKKYGVPFHEVYTEWNNAYNEAYAAMDELRFMRPNLYPLSGEIGGHCVVPNCDLLQGEVMTNFVKARNEVYKKEVPYDKPKRKDRKKYQNLAVGTKQHTGL